MRAFVGWVVDNPWKIVFAALVVTGVFGSFIPGINLVTNFEEYLSPDNPAIKAANEAEERYGSQTFLKVTIESEKTIFETEVLKRIDDLRGKIAGIEGVKKVEGPLNSQIIIGKKDSLVVDSVAPGGELPTTEEEMARFRKRLMGSNLLVDRVVSSSGKSAAFTIELAKDIDEPKVADRIQTVANNYKGPEEIYLAGLPFTNSVLSEAILSDLVVLLPLVFVAIGLVLYMSFRSLRGLLLPLLVVSLSTTWSIGLMALIGIPFTLISFILPVVLVAVGTAYSIHVLNKYYELADKLASKREVIVETAVAMYSPVTMAGLTTAAGFLALISSFLLPQRQFGIFAALGVLFSIIFSLSLVPAILSLLPLQQLKSGEIIANLGRLRESILTGFERFVTDNNKMVLALFVLLLVVFTVGTFRVNIETSQTSFLGKDSPVTKGLNSLDKNFSGGNRLLIEIDTGKSGGLKNPEMLRKMEELQNWLTSKEGVKVTKTFSLVNIIKELNQKYHGGDPDFYRLPKNKNLISQLLLLFSFQGGGLGNLALGDYSAGEITGFFKTVSSSKVVQLKSAIQNYLKENFPQVDAELVGSTRVSAMVYSKVVSSQLVSLLASIVIAGLIVGLIIRSASAGLISLVPLVLTVLINFGIMGYSGTPLDLATLMVSSIVIGIGIDYAIHFIERFRREYEEDKSELEIFSATLRTTGRGIFYNALALTLGFGVLMFSTFEAIFNFGFLMALTMIISMVSAFTVIPAILFIFRPGFIKDGEN
ncbi:MAG: RND family transporter [Candidatus Bipolaricaulia bacterium]